MFERCDGANIYAPAAPGLIKPSPATTISGVPMRFCQVNIAGNDRQSSVLLTGNGVGLRPVTRDGMGWGSGGICKRTVAESFSAEDTEPEGRGASRGLWGSHDQRERAGIPSLHTHHAGQTAGDGGGQIDSTEIPSITTSIQWTRLGSARVARKLPTSAAAGAVKEVREVVTGDYKRVFETMGFKYLEIYFHSLKKLSFMSEEDSLLACLCR